MTEASDRWDGGGEYESYIGRWSRHVAETFIDWLDAPEGASWLEVGCGTGALTSTIVARSAPAGIVASDRSAEFVAHAAAALDDPRVEFLVSDAGALPLPGASADVVVSGLLLNFLPAPPSALAELCRVARPGATVAAYVWDYAEGMEPIRAFWDAATSLAPSARDADEAVRFPLCRPDRLEQLFAGAGLGEVRTRTIDVKAVFRDFDDYWTPFLSGIGPAPGYCLALPEDQREALRARLAERLAPQGDGPISMNARAFAVRGTMPAGATAPRRVAE